MLLFAATLPLLLCLDMAGSSSAPGPEPGAVPSSDRSDPEGDLRELRTRLRSGRSDDRRRAVARLAKVGSPGALDLVMASLADPVGEVADTAQRLVVTIPGSAVVEALLGRGGLGSRDPWVKRRAAEALGRCTVPVDARRLARAFPRRDDEALRAALWTVERLAGSGGLAGDPAALLPRVKASLRGSAADAVRARALMALSALDPGTALSHARQFALEAEGERAAAGLTLWVRSGEPEALETLHRACAARDPFLRRVAVDLLGLHGTRASLESLVARLGQEARPLLRERIVEALRQRTGFRHGDKVRAWVRTLRDLGPEWEPAGDDGREREGPGGAAVPGGSAAAIGRLQPRSDRLGILVDFSGSLWNVRKDGTRRKDILEPEVERLLGRLPEDARFYLAPYTRSPHPVAETPQRATRRNVGAAQRAFVRETATGPGNVWDALLGAMEHRELDRIMILTDGAPTGGRRWDVPLIVELLLERTRFRPVTFDVVLLDAPPSLVRRWERLAQRSGGRAVIVGV